MPVSLLRNARTLITGANRGLGLEWVRQLADRADTLFATCRCPDEADALHRRATQHPDTIDVFALDVAEADAISAAAERVRTETGALDLLVNNAGISGGGRRDRFAGVDRATMMEAFRVNAAGPHLLTKACADLLREGAANERAVVVNLTSQLGSIANTRGDGWHSYKASKAALNMCTRPQAAALRDEGGIAVAVPLGWGRTDMGSANARLSTEEFLADTIDGVTGLSLGDTSRFLAQDG
jgi:NAD(P)-dependent dehydrogenase (short-subunit alcohol dehydrogenase family)